MLDLGQTALQSPRPAGVSADSAHEGPKRLLAYTLLAMLALLPLVPALLLPYLPTVDGPAHVLDAYVLAHYDDPDRAALRQAYVLTAAPTPNLLTQVLLAVLLEALSPAVAEKVFALAVVALFGLAATYAIRVIDPRNTFLAALAAPLATGYFFYFGFYNFCLGIGLFLFSTGFFLRHRGSWTSGRTAALLALLLVTASAHLLPFGMVALFIGFTVVTDALRAAQADRAGHSGGARRLHAVLREEALPAAAALIVPSVLILRFLMRSDNVQGVGMDPDAPDNGPSAFSIRQLLRATVGQVSVYSRQEVGLGLLLFAALAVLLVLAARKLASARVPAPELLVPLGMMVLLCTALYLFFPATVGTLALIRPRFGLFAVLFALLSLATLPHHRRAAAVTILIAVVVSCGLPIVRHTPQSAVMRDLREYQTAADVLPAHSSFVTFRTAHTASLTSGGTSYDFAAHQASRVAMASDTIQLNHLDGRYDYFPAHFRDLDRLGARMTDLEYPSQWRQLLEETRGAAGPDYVLVWGRGRAEPDTMLEPDYREAQRLLDAEYRRVWVSEPEGLLEVFQHR